MEINHRRRFLTKKTKKIEKHRIVERINITSAKMCDLNGLKLELKFLHLKFTRIATKS